MSDVRTTWRDPETGLVHQVIVENVRLQRAAGGAHRAGGITTVCGIELPAVELDRDDPVTCAWCLNADEIAGLTAGMGTPAPAERVSA